MRFERAIPPVALLYLVLCVRCLDGYESEEMSIVFNLSTGQCSEGV